MTARPTAPRAPIGYLVAGVLLLVAACGDSGDGAGETAGNDVATTTAVEGTAPAAGTDEAVTAPVATSTSMPGETSPAAAAAGECRVSVTGDVEASASYPQEIGSFSTDYWLSEDDLRDTVEFLGEDIAGGSYEDLVARGAPIITFFQVACSAQDDPVSLAALVTVTNATTAADIPVGPGTYPISGGLFDADGPAGTVIADFSLSEDELFATVAGSGSLDISRWDDDAIEGSFGFDAEEIFVDTPRTVRVEVTFAFVCADWFTGC